VYDVSGKTAVVTGAAGGMGLGMARSFANAGMNVVLADVDAEQVELAANGLRADGCNAIGTVTDVGDEAQVQALAATTLEHFGSVHVVANNAGIGIPGTVDEMPLDEWQWTLDVDLWGVIYGIRTFMPILKEQGEGHITATSSQAGLVGGPVLGAYHVAKHGVVGLMDTVRIELKLAKSDVRASVLCPGAVDTQIAYSERNRPDGLETKEANKLEEKYFANLRSTLADGMAPDQVGDLVLDAVTNERFWIFTHPEEAIDIVERRLAAMKRDHAHRL